MEFKLTLDGIEIKPVREITIQSKICTDERLLRSRFLSAEISEKAINTLFDMINGYNIKVEIDFSLPLDMACYKPNRIILGECHNMHYLFYALIHEFCHHLEMLDGKYPELYAICDHPQNEYLCRLFLERGHDLEVDTERRAMDMVMTHFNEIPVPLSNYCHPHSKANYKAIWEHNLAMYTRCNDIPVDFKMKPDSLKRIHDMIEWKLAGIPILDEE